MRNAGLIADGRPWPGPQEVIVLTPAADLKPVKNKSYLRYPAPEDAIWKGRYSIDGTTCRGLAMTCFWWDFIHVNLDRAGEEQLGLRPGMTFRLEVADFVFEVVHVGDIDSRQLAGSQLSEWARSLAGGRKEFGFSFRLRDFPESDQMLKFPRVVATTKFPIHSKWLPAVLTLLPERHEIPAAIT
jgi:hypothetical protein